MSSIPLLSPDKREEYKNLISSKNRSFVSRFGSWMISFLRYTPIGTAEHKAQTLFKKINEQKTLNPALLRVLNNAEDRILGQILVLSKKQPLQEDSQDYLSIIENILYERSIPITKIPSPSTVFPNTHLVETSETPLSSPPEPPKTPPPLIKQAAIKPLSAAEKLEEMRLEAVQNLRELLRIREEKPTTQAFITHLQACIDYLSYKNEAKNYPSLPHVINQLRQQKAKLENLQERVQEGKEIAEFVGVEGESFPHNSVQLEEFGKVSTALHELESLKILVASAKENIKNASESVSLTIIKETFANTVTRWKTVLPLLHSLTKEPLTPSLLRLESLLSSLEKEGDKARLEEVETIRSNLCKPFVEKQKELDRTLSTLFFEKNTLKPETEKVETYGPCVTLELTPLVEMALDALPPNFTEKDKKIFAQKVKDALFLPITKKWILVEKNAPSTPRHAVLEDIKKITPTKKPVSSAQEISLPKFISKTLMKKDQDILASALTHLETPLLTDNDITLLAPLLSPDNRKILELGKKPCLLLEEMDALSDVITLASKDKSVKEQAEKLSESIVLEMSRIKDLRAELDKGNLEFIKKFSSSFPHSEKTYSLLSDQELLVLCACQTLDAPTPLFKRLSLQADDPAQYRRAKEALSLIANEPRLTYLTTTSEYLTFQDKIKKREQEIRPLASFSPKERFTNKEPPTLQKTEFSTLRDVKSFIAACKNLGENQANYTLAAQAKLFSPEIHQSPDAIEKICNELPLLSALFILDSSPKGRLEDVFVEEISSRLCREKQGDILAYLDKNLYDRRVSTLYKKIISKFCEKLAGQKPEDIAAKLQPYSELQKVFFLDLNIDRPIRLSVAAELDYFDREVLMPLIEQTTEADLPSDKLKSEKRLYESIERNTITDLSCPYLDAEKAVETYIKLTSHKDEAFSHLKERLLLLDKSAKNALEKENLLTQKEQEAINTAILEKLTLQHQKNKPLSPLLANCPRHIRTSFLASLPPEDRLNAGIHYLIDCPDCSDPDVSEVCASIKEDFTQELLNTVPDEGNLLAKKAKELLLQHSELHTLLEERKQEAFPHSLTRVSPGARNLFFNNKDISLKERLSMAYKVFPQLNLENQTLLISLFSQNPEPMEEPESQTEKIFFNKIQDQKKLLEVITLTKSNIQNAKRLFDSLSRELQEACILNPEIPPHRRAILAGDTAPLLRAIAPRYPESGLQETAPLFPYVKAVKILEAFTPKKGLKEPQARAQKLEALQTLAISSDKIQKACFYSATSQQLRELLQMASQEHFSFLFKKALPWLAERFVAGDAETFQDFIKNKDPASLFLYETLAQQVETALTETLKATPSSHLLRQFVVSGFSIVSLFNASSDKQKLLQTLSLLPAPLLLKSALELEGAIPEKKKLIHPFLLKGLLAKRSETLPILPTLKGSLLDEVISTIVTSLTKEMETKDIRLNPLFTSLDVKKALFSSKNAPLEKLLPLFFQEEEASRKELRASLLKRVQGCDVEILLKALSSPIQLEDLLPEIKNQFQTSNPLLNAKRLSALPEEIKKALLDTHLIKDSTGDLSLFTEGEEEKLAIELTKIDKSSAEKILEKSSPKVRDAYQKNLLSSQPDELVSTLMHWEKDSPLPENTLSASFEVKKSTFELEAFPAEKALALLVAGLANGQYEQRELFSLLGEKLCLKNNVGLFPQYLDALKILSPIDQETILSKLSKQAKEKRLLDAFIKKCPQDHPLALEILYTDKYLEEYSFEKIPQELTANILLRLDHEKRAHFFSSDKIDLSKKLALGYLFVQPTSALSPEERINLHQKLYKVITNKNLKLPQGIFSRTLYKKINPFEESLLAFLRNNTKERFDFLSQKTLPVPDLLHFADVLFSEEEEDTFVGILAETCSPSDALSSLNKQKEGTPLFSFYKKLLLVACLKSQSAQELFAAPENVRNTLIPAYFSSSAIPLQTRVQQAASFSSQFTSFETTHVASALLERFLNPQKEDLSDAWNELQKDNPFLQIVRSNLILSEMYLLQEKPFEEKVSSLRQLPEALRTEIFIRFFSSAEVRIENLLKILGPFSEDESVKSSLIPILYKSLLHKSIATFRLVPSPLRKPLFQQFRQHFREHPSLEQILIAAEGLEQKDVASEIEMVSQHVAENLLNKEPFDSETASSLILSELVLDQALLHQLWQKMDPGIQDRTVSSILLKQPDARKRLLKRLPDSGQIAVFEKLSLKDQLELFETYEGREVFKSSLLSVLEGQNGTFLRDLFQTKTNPVWKDILQETAQRTGLTLFKKEKDEIKLYPEACLEALASSTDFSPLSLIHFFDEKMEKISDSIFSTLASRIIEEPALLLRQEAFEGLSQAKKIGQAVCKEIAKQKVKTYKALVQKKRDLAEAFLQEPTLVQKYLLTSLLTSGIDPLLLLRTADRLITKIPQDTVEEAAKLLSQIDKMNEKTLHEPNPDIIIREFHGKIVALKEAAKLLKEPNPQAIADRLKNSSGVERIRLLQAYFEQATRKTSLEVLLKLPNLPPEEKSIIQDILKRKPSV